MNNFLVLFYIALSYLIIIFSWINEPLRNNHKYKNNLLYLSSSSVISNENDVITTSTTSNSIIKRRRIRYSGKYPKHFNEKYKEKIEDEQIIQKVIAKGGTPAGQHRPIMLNECMKYLNLDETNNIINLDDNKEDIDNSRINNNPKLITSSRNSSINNHNKVVCIDCTLGFGGHSMEILKRIIPKGGILFGLDQDQKELEKTEIRLKNILATYNITQDNVNNNNNIDDRYVSIHHENFGNLLSFSKQHDIVGKVTSILVDLGYSSMQIDDPLRGFTYKYQGPLDMRMNATTSIISNNNNSDNNNQSNITTDTLTAYQYLMMLKHPRKLVNVLKTNSDIEEYYAIPIAHAIFNHQQGGIPNTTFEFADRIRSAYIQTEKNLHSSSTTSNNNKLTKSSIDSMIARCFQAIRIEVNSEFNVLDNMLEALPYVLAPNGHAVILTFHSGEDRRVKKSFKQGFNDGIYKSWSRDVIIASNDEKHSNSRAKCCKLRWIIRSSKVL